MVLNIVNKLSRGLNLVNPTFDINKPEQFVTEPRSLKRSKLWSGFVNNKSINTKINKYQKREALVKSNESISGDDKPLLHNNSDDISKLSTKSSIKYNEIFEEPLTENKTNTALNEEFGKIGKEKIIQMTRTNNERVFFNSPNEQILSSFNYKSFPLSNIQIMNWINENWSEVESDEINTKECLMVEIDALIYKKIENVNKRVITPFHSLTAPKISIGEYFITRITKFMALTPVDFCVVAILVRRAINNSNGILKTTTLTSHRLVLAASLLTYKLMYDVQYGLKFWAHIGGVPHWEMVMLEHHLLKILNWDLNITFQEFIEVYYEILSSKNTSKKLLLNKELIQSQQKNKTKKISITPQANRNKCTLLQINVRDNNSDRKKY